MWKFKIIADTQKTMMKEKSWGDDHARRRGFITTDQLKKIGERLQQTDYGQYILSLAEGERS